MVVAEDGPTRDAQVAFAELSRVLVDARPLSAVLALVARSARDTLPGPGEASVSLRGPAGMTTVGGTGPLAAALDSLQHAAGAGPCVAAALGGGTVRVDDTSAEPVHRDFAETARRQGVTSVLAIGLPVGSRSVGSLTLYRTGGGPFDAAATGLARAFAGYAAGAVATAAARRRPGEMGRDARLAMQSRAVIEQAKGVLVAWCHCTPEEAFGRLAAESQRTNRKLRDIAAELVSAAQEPSGPAPA